MKIILVDDEKLARSRMRELIEKSGEHSIIGGQGARLQMLKVDLWFLFLFLLLSFFLFFSLFF